MRSASACRFASSAARLAAAACATLSDSARRLSAAAWRFPSSCAFCRSITDCLASCSVCCFSCFLIRSTDARSSFVSGRLDVAGLGAGALTTRAGPGVSAVIVAAAAAGSFVAAGFATGASGFGDSCSARQRKLPAAPLTRMSRRPKVSTVRPTTAATSSGRRTSPVTARERTPSPVICSAVSWRCSWFRLEIATSHPRDAIANAMPRQMPVPPPVMSAARPASNDGT